MKLLRRILLALLFALLVGFAIGTVLRMRLERPARYIGSATGLPFHVGHPGPAVLDPSHHEQQIG